MLNRQLLAVRLQPRRKNRSSIALFDTYVETKVKGKRVSTVSVDELSSKTASRTNLLIPNVDEYDVAYDVESIEVPEQLRQHIQVGRRGDYIRWLKTSKLF